MKMIYLMLNTTDMFADDTAVYIEGFSTSHMEVARLLTLARCLLASGVKLTI